MRKLSEISGEEVFEFLAEIVEPVANLAESEPIKELFAKREVPEGMTPGQFVTQRIKGNLPVLLRENRADIIAILAAASGCTPEEYERDMTLPSFVHDASILITDQDFMAFLS